MDGRVETPDMVLARHLGPQERLLWSGQPRQGIILRANDVMTIPFSLMWGGFAIFWQLSVFHAGAPFLFRLWGIPFVAIGVYMIFGRFLVDSSLRARTYYGITNDRVIIVSGSNGQKVNSINLHTTNNIGFTEGTDGRGTIMFGIGPLMPRWTAQARGWPGAPLVPMLEGIEQGRMVLDLINQVQNRV